MIETTIVWHNAKEERPAKSGRYLIGVRHAYPYVCTVSYSKVHDKFNCADIDKEPAFTFEPDFWAEMTPLEVFKA